MSVIDTLIIDRTLADVTQRTAKGTYNAEDLNRVGEAVIYVADHLRAAGYDVAANAKTNWTDAEWMTPTAAKELLAGVSDLRKQFAQVNGTPLVPTSVERMTYAEANNIERILQTIDSLLTNIMTAWYFSGEVYSGEV